MSIYISNRKFFQVEIFYGGLIQEECKNNNSNFQVQHSELISLDDQSQGHQKLVVCKGRIGKEEKYCFAQVISMKWKYLLAYNAYYRGKVAVSSFVCLQLFYNDDMYIHPCHTLLLFLHQFMVYKDLIIYESRLSLLVVSDAQCCRQQQYTATTTATVYHYLIVDATKASNEREEMKKIDINIFLNKLLE